MKIIVDCQAVLHHCVNHYSAQFVLSCHEYLLQNKNAVEWLFLIDKKYLDKESINRIPAKNILFKKKLLPGWRFWYDSELPSLVKKHAADLLITLGGVACSSPIPQCTWIPEIAESSGSKKNVAYFAFYKKRLAKTLDCSKVIFTCCEKKRQEFIGQYGVSNKKVMLVRVPADQRYQILSWTEKETMKVKYAAGKEYYFARVDFPENSLINLLKAFSQFKKRQQSNIQFVLAGTGLKASSGFIEKLKTFKYKTEVHIYETLDEKDLIKLTSAAYGLVHPFDDDESGAVVTGAFRANVAVIASGKSSLREIAVDAALYASLDNVELLASQMMLLYKDENLRLALIQKGNLISQQFDRNTSMEELQNAILQGYK